MVEHKKEEHKKSDGKHEEKAEHKTEHKAEHKAEHKTVHKKKNSKINLWMIAAIVIAIAWIATAFISSNAGSEGISETEASDVVTSYIESNVPGAELTIDAIEDIGDLYKVDLDLGGQKFESYLSKDGKLLFPSGIPIESEEADEEDEEDVTPIEVKSEVEKSEKPDVEVFVMSHCPYGTQIEKGILPVAELLGDKIDFEIKFVNYAMHGQTELDEQLNQYCIQKENNDVYLDYLACFLKEGKTAECVEEVDLDQDDLDACIESADEEFGITADFEDKDTWMGNYPPFSIYEAENKAYGVRGSPTLVINGATASSGRDSASLLKAICDAFTEAPEECDEELDSASPSPGFGYNAATGSATDAGCGA